MSRNNESQTTPTILCVDDQPEVIDSITRLLHKYRVKVKSAYHGMQGIWYGFTDHPDLIITDFKMPFANGAELVQIMNHVPVIAITGVRDTEVETALRAAGARAVLNKPFDFDALLAEIGRWIPLELKQIPNSTRKPQKQHKKPSSPGGMQ